MWKRFLLIALLLIPAAAWAFFKPVRIVAPEFNGVSCLTSNICVDESARYAEASMLYEEALTFVESAAGDMRQKPRVIFCATEYCFRSFGFEHGSAVNIGTFGIIIGPRAWEPHYVRHEMIHHVQKEQLGNLNAWLITPKWFTEGMAYSLSKDPRPKLAEPWEQYRSQFDAWYRQVGKDRLWEEAGSL